MDDKNKDSHSISEEPQYDVKEIDHRKFDFPIVLERKPDQSIDHYKKEKKLHNYLMKIYLKGEIVWNTYYQGTFEGSVKQDLKFHTYEEKKPEQSAKSGQTK